MKKLPQKIAKKNFEKINGKHFNLLPRFLCKYKTSLIGLTCTNNQVDKVCADSDYPEIFDTGDRDNSGGLWRLLLFFFCEVDSWNQGGWFSVLSLSTVRWLSDGLFPYLCPQSLKREKGQFEQKRHLTLTGVPTPMRTSRNLVASTLTGLLSQIGEHWASREITLIALGFSSR